MANTQPHNIRRSFIKNNGWTLFGQILVNAHGILFIPLIFKSTGAATYGGYVLVITSLGFLYGVSSFGIGYNSKRYLASAVNSEDRNTLFYPQFFFRVMIIAFLSVLALLLRLSVQDWLENQNISFFAPLIPIYLFGMFIYTQFTDYFRFTRQITIFNIAVVLMPYLNIGLLFIASSLRLFTLNVNMLVASQSIVLWVIGIILMIVGLREMGLPHIFLNIRQSWEDIQIGFPLTLELVVNTILNIGDRFFIGYFLTATAVGHYNPAYAIGALISFIPNVSWLVLPPLLSVAIDSGREQDAKQLIGYTVRGFLLISVPFVVGASVLAKPILGLLANDAVADNAYAVVPFVAMGTVFYGLNVIFSNMLFVQKKTSLVFRVSLVAAIANILLNLVFLSLFKHILVSGIVTLVSYLLSFIILQRSISNDWDRKDALGVLAKALLASGAMALVLMGVPLLFPLLKSGTLFLLAKIAVGALIYFLALFLFGGVSRKEISILWKGFAS